MIREIINFTENLMADIPDIMQWKVQPNVGLHIFIDIDENGNWINSNLEKSKDYEYYDGKNQDIGMWKECLKYQNVTDYITMNKVQKFDPKQKIHSCSPFAVAFNFNFNDSDKETLGIKIWKKGEKPTDEEKKKNQNLIRIKRIAVIKERLSDYEKFSKCVFWGKELKYEKELSAFYKIVHENVLDATKNIKELDLLEDKDYIRINLRSIDFNILQEGYSNYLQQEILNGEMMEGYGALGFMTTFPSKKPFIRHKTSFLIKGVSQRFSKEDALFLNNFEKLLKRKQKCLPNPLPIVIDCREINESIVKLFNEEENPISYREILNKLFEQKNIKELSNYYLLNYSNTMSGLQFNDFDFVPLFRYYIEPKIAIQNVCQSGIIKDKIFEKFANEDIKTIFDFERIVVREIFNNSLIKIKNDKYSTNYFGDIDPRYISGGDTMYLLIMKYRKAFYDYIYKSKTNAISGLMFEEIMYQSILSNIQKDDIKVYRCEWNNTIKKKINIWFSLYHLFNNNNQEIMASKVTNLIEKMSKVAKGEVHFETSEEFAFGAGQVVSYLIDRSAASNKTYAMLEPYLQKAKSGQLQDSIAQTIAVYKHDISTYKSNFEGLASNVLTYDENIDVKPLLKYFLAGCFSPCVVYQKKEDNNN